jgi:predicted transposase/invertase (TIGR01784 family)
MDTTIKKAHEKMTFVSSDKEVLRLYHMRQMAIYDFNTSVKVEREEGREEGEQIGLKKGREQREQKKQREIPKNLKAMGIPIATGLSPEEIKQLK